MSTLSPKRSYLFIFAVTLDAIILDQVTKWLAASNLQTPQNITPWFSLEYAENTGVAFSFPIPYAVLIPVSFLMVVAILAYGIRTLKIDSPITIAILGLITGGALGNMIDRIFQGFVIDFIKIGWWPTFNLADAFLCIGIFLLFVFYGKIRRA